LLTVHHDHAEADFGCGGGGAGRRGVGEPVEYSSGPQNARRRRALTGFDAPTVRATQAITPPPNGAIGARAPNGAARAPARRVRRRWSSGEFGRWLPLTLRHHHHLHGPAAALRSLPVAVVDAAPAAIDEDISRDVAAPEALLLTGGAVSNLLGAFWRIHGNSVKFLVRMPTAP